MARRLFPWVALFFLAFSLPTTTLQAAIIPDDPENPTDGWKDPRAYRPNPILFLHGFASGQPSIWKDDRPGQINVTGTLDPYFRNYYTGYNPDDPTILGDTAFPYLELISFVDFTQPWRGQLIDRNSSVDTYQVGDYYVGTAERTAGSPGWSDKVHEAIQKLQAVYLDKNNRPLKVILVGHSMGGLAAREYLANSKYTFALSAIEKIIFIGTPHLGSPFASLADGITKAQRVGWFIPGVGWLFSSGIEVLDTLVEKRSLIDIDGDAVRDMDPSSRGSGFLALLNGRPQPQNIGLFAIYGNSRGLTDTLVSRQLYQGQGDGVVSKDSQLGTGALTLTNSIEINASHGNEPVAVVADPERPLLKFLDYTTPEVTITLPDPNAASIPEIDTKTENIQGAVSREYLPADCLLNVTALREEDGTAEVKIQNQPLLYPSDLWNSDDPNSVVAEFDEPIEFKQSGTYTISVTVTNPAGRVSAIKTTRVRVTLKNPVIIIQSPTPGKRLTERRPLIQARIYSPSNINIDLASIELLLDSTVVPHTVTPDTGGPDVTISHTPAQNLSVNDPNTSGINESKHTVVVHAQDGIGLMAQETTSRFEILLLCPRKIVEWMRAINQRQMIAGVRQTVFYNYDPERIPYGISLGTPDGGNAVPSLDALDSYMFLPDYILDLRRGLESLLSRYWNNAEEKPWTLQSLYQSAMGTTGTGPGKDSWAHVLELWTNGIETIDLLEIQKCVEKPDSPIFSMENQQGKAYYYLRKFSQYDQSFGRYGSYSDCQNATPDSGSWSGGGHACGQLAWRASSSSKDWFIGRYYWSFNTSVLSGLGVASAKLRWKRTWPLTIYSYYRHFTLNFRQISFDAKSPRIPSDWGQGGALAASRNSETWNEKFIFLEEIPPSLINTSGGTQFELTSNRDEAKDEVPMPPVSGNGTHEEVIIPVADNYLIVTVTGFKN